MTPKQEKLRKAYEFKIGKERTNQLSDEQILLLSKYYNSLSDSEQSAVDNALVQGRSNDLTDMADAFISENEQDVYEPSDIIKQYDEQFDEAVAAYNKKVEDFKEKEDKRIAGMFQYEEPIGPQVDEERFRKQTNAKIEDYQREQRIKEILEKRKKKTGSSQYKSPIGPQPMQGPKEPPVQGPKEPPVQGPKEPPVQGPKEPPVQGPRQASKDDEPWESEVQDQLGTKIDEVLEQIRNEPLPQPTKTKRRKSKGKKVLSRKSYTAQELGVGESLNEILQNVVETREAMLNLYKLEKQRFEFKKRIDKKLTAALAAKKRESDLEKPKDPNTGVPNKKKTFAQKAKEYTKKSLIEAAVTAAFVAALPLIIEGLRPFFKDRTRRDMENAREGYNNQALDFMNVFPDDILNTPAGTFNPKEGGPSSAADQSGGLGQPDVPPGAVKTESESESKPNTTAEPITPKEPLIPKETGPGQFTPYGGNWYDDFSPSDGSWSPFNTGGPVPGPKVNKDVIPAMLTPGQSDGSWSPFNTGGPVPGPKVNKDVIPAMLTPGQFTPYGGNWYDDFSPSDGSWSPFNTGGPVPGPKVNKDVIPAMLTPGEFVMSRGAVNKFGLNVMMSMNKSGGGTNRPTYKGMLPGYQGGGPVGKLPQSGADFWTLVAVAGTEDNDPQAWADVAQSIYNRAASGVYAGGSDIRQLILTPKQYEPTWKHPVKKAEQTPNPEWYNIVDINSAAVATGKSVEYLQRVADTIQNPDYQQKAAEFVQGRTDFMGGKEKPRFDLGDVRRGEQGEDNFFGFFAGPGAEAYGETNPDPGAIPSFVGTNVKMKPQQQPQAQKGDQSTPGAAPQEEYMKFFEFINPIRIFNEIRTNVQQRLRQNEETRIQRNENLRSNLRSFNRTSPVEASPRRNVSMMPEIATMMSAPPPSLPDIAQASISSPAGRRSPQQPGA